MKIGIILIIIQMIGFLLALFISHKNGDLRRAAFRDNLYEESIDAGELVFILFLIWEIYIPAKTIKFVSDKIDDSIRKMYEKKSR